MIEKLKKLFENKHIRILAGINLIVLMILMYEFVLFQYGPLKILRYVVLLEALFVIAWKDQKERIILNVHLIWMLGIRSILLIIECLMYPDLALSIFWGSFMGMFIGFLLFFVCYLISRGGMGAGDVKLVAVLGYYVGGSVIMMVLILSSVSAAIFSIINLLRKKTNLKMEIPFAPFVLVGTILSMMLGA